MTMQTLGTTEKRPVIFVHGPAGCGKTHHKDRISEMFGNARVIEQDDLNFGREEIQPGDVILCIDPMSKRDMRLRGLQVEYVPYSVLGLPTMTPEDFEEDDFPPMFRIGLACAAVAMVIAAIHFT